MTRLEAELDRIICEFKNKKGRIKMSADGKKKSFFMPIPAGTPYSIIAEATHKFRVELVEKPVQVLPSAEGNVVPMAWVLVGEKDELIRAKAFIYERLREALKRFE